jgi:hypothetical protein
MAVTPRGKAETQRGMPRRSAGCRDAAGDAAPQRGMPRHSGGCRATAWDAAPQRGMPRRGGGCHAAAGDAAPQRGMPRHSGGAETQRGTPYALPRSRGGGLQPALRSGAGRSPHRNSNQPNTRIHSAFYRFGRATPPNRPRPTRNTITHFSTPRATPKAHYTNFHHFTAPCLSSSTAPKDQQVFLPLRPLSAIRDRIRVVIRGDRPGTFRRMLRAGIKRRNQGSESPNPSGFQKGHAREHVA